jgi:hypothetical protein
MKKAIFLLALAYATACNEPLTVTGRTDPQQTTSGTMGSVKANNQMPALDTPNVRRRVDTTRRP